MFRKRDRLDTIEAVLDAVITLLHKKRLISRASIQKEILRKDKSESIIDRQFQ